MEFTGFCYSNSRVSLFYFGEMFGKLEVVTENSVF